MVEMLLGALRPTPSLRFTSFPKFSISKTSLTPRGFSPFNTIASLHSTSLSEPATTQTGTEIPSEESEIIFLGTGTSEGIPRVSCLTNPYRTCKVCSKAVKPGDKNRRLNTSILIRYPEPSGKRNILIDAGNS